MALARILGGRDQIVDNGGRPLAGGTVDLFEPNTTNRITSYKDSALQQENTNPVKLSGAGRADIWISRNCDLRILDANGRPVVEELSVNPDDLGGLFDSGLVPNGSFEVDTDADNVPDGWDNDVNDPGSDNRIDTTESTSGGQSWRTTSTGTGAGELVTEAFFPVNDVDDLRINFDLRATVAAIRNIVRVQWYDVSQVFLSNSDVYDSTANPLTFTSQQTLASPPTGARFAKLRIIGGAAGGQVAGSTYWDRFNVFYPQEVPGVFDNITIANNDIVSTNTNGNINVTPNGTGLARIKNLRALQTAELGVGDATKIKALATGAGILADIVTATPPTTEAVTAAVTFSDSDDSDELGRVGYAGSNDLRVQNVMHGGNVILQAETGAGVLNTILDGNPGGAVELSFAGSPTLRVDGAGSVAIRGDANTDTDLRVLDLEQLDGTTRARLGHQSDANLRLANKVHGGTILLTGETVGGVEQTLLAGDPDDGVALSFNGSIRLETLTDGARARGSSNAALGGAQTASIQLTRDDSTPLARLGFVGAQNLTVRSTNNGGNLLLEANDAAGALQTLLEGDPDGAVTLSHDGGSRFITGVGRVGVRSDGNTDTERRTLELQHQNGTRRGQLGYVGSSTLFLRNEINGAPVEIQAFDTGGVQRNLFTGDPDGNVELYHDATARLRVSAGGYVDVLADDNLEATVRGFRLAHANGTIRAALQVSGSAVQLVSQIHGANLTLRAENGSGNERTLVTLDPDAGVQLGHGATADVLETTDRTAADAVTGAQVRHFDGTKYDVGLGIIPSLDVTANLTLTQTHAHKRLRCNAVSAITVTFPNDPDIADGAAGQIMNIGSDPVTLAQGASHTISWLDGSGVTNGARTLAVGGWLYWTKHANGRTYIQGVGIS